MHAKFVPHIDMRYIFKIPSKRKVVPVILHQNPKTTWAERCLLAATFLEVKDGLHAT